MPRTVIIDSLNWQHTSIRKNRQAQKRGWTDEDIQEVLDNPAETLPAPRGNLATGNPATIYYRADGYYVIRDDATGDMVQYSDIHDANWLDEGENNEVQIRKRP